MYQVEKRNIRKAMDTVPLPNTNYKGERCDKDCHSKNQSVLVTKDIAQQTHAQTHSLMRLTEADDD